MTEDTDQVRSRLLRFLATMRYHDPACDSTSEPTERSGLQSAIVVSHSLFIKEFCRGFMSSDARAADVFLEHLCTQKVANASVVAVDVTFGDGVHCIA